MNIELNKAIAKIEIVRHSEKDATANIQMPVFIEMRNEQLIDIWIPLFGIETYAEKQEDIDTAINEALRCFFKVAISHGRGLQEELESLGWKAKNSRTLRFKLSETNRVNKIPSNFSLKGEENPALQNLLRRGISKKLSFNVAA